MYVDAIEIKNLRGFAQAGVEFVHPELRERPPIDNVTLLVGDNSSGKTSVLRAIAIGCLGPVLANGGFVPDRLIRRTRDGLARAAQIIAKARLHPPDGVGISAVGKLNWPIHSYIKQFGDTEILVPTRGLVMPAMESWHRDNSGAALVLGYGAQRRVEFPSEYRESTRRRVRTLRHDRIASLFEEQVTLAPLEAWLPKLEFERPDLFEQVRVLLDTLVPDTRFTAKLGRGEYLFERHGVAFGYSALSDGFRDYIGLLGDILYHICLATPPEGKLRSNRGIVLVDEVGLHLHPSWQRVVATTIAKALPMLQFVMTSHSPIVAGTLHAANVRRCWLDDEGCAHVERLSEEIHGLDAAQILHGHAFGLDSSRAPDFVAELHRLSSELAPDDIEGSLKILELLAKGSAAHAPVSTRDVEVPGWVAPAAAELPLEPYRARPEGKSPAKKSPAKKSPAKKSSAKKSSAKRKASAKKSSAKRKASA